VEKEAAVVTKIQKLIEEAEKSINKWSDKVPHSKTFKTPEGLFKNKSSQEIAKVISENKEAPYATAMSRLNFYLNRGGKNIPSDIRAKVNAAKEVLKKMYKRV
jgi:hypothetical protein